MRIAVLASGVGSNLTTILEHAQSGRLSVEPCLALSNNPEAGALLQAAKFGVPVWSKSHVGLPREEYDAELLGALYAAKAEAVILAGYMRLLSKVFFNGFSGPILNLHPSLLPAFPGAGAPQQSFAYGERLVGCSVHFVEEVVDSGPLIIQAALPVDDDDTFETLMPKIRLLEHRIYPQAIQWLAQKRLAPDCRSGCHPEACRRIRLLPRSGPAVPAPQVELPFPYLVSPGLEDF